MSFRGKTLIACCVLLFTTSCSWWGDKTDQTDGITLDAIDVLRFGDINCIKNTGSFFADFFYGHSSTSEIESMQSCIENTLDSMFDLAYKDDEIGFNRERVKNVLASVVSTNDEYDLDDLSELIFRLKRFFVGGGKNSFYKEEWQRFRPDLKEIAAALIQSQNASKLIFFSGKDKGLIEREGLYEKLFQSFTAIDRIKNKHLKTLKIEEIESLVTVLLKVSSLDKFIPVAMTAREMIYPTEEIFEQRQASFLNTVWDVFHLQARAREINFQEGLLVGESSADLIKALRILTSRLKMWSNENSETYNFNTSQIKRMVGHLFEIGFLKTVVKDVAPINTTIENMFTRIFGSDTLIEKDFIFLSNVFENWANYYPRLLIDLDSEWARNVYNVLSTDESFSDQNHEEVDQILRNFENPKFISGPNTPIHILYDNDRVLTSEEIYLDRSLKQLFLALAEPVTKVYNPHINEDLDGSDVLFSIEGLDKLLSDFRPIGLELGFINRYSCDSSGRIFMESNLMTQNANGDDFISLIEAAEWLGTMIVTSSLTDHIFSRVDEECAYGGEEIYGYPFYDRTCFQNSMFNNRANLENYFPGFSDYMSLLNSGRRPEFEDKIGGWFNYANSYYDYNELDPDYFELVYMNQMNTCFQVKDQESYLDFPLSRSEFNATIATMIYVENFFTKYDTTGISGILSEDPEGSDLIIDGKELSVFVREKVNQENTRRIARVIRENWWARRFGGEDRWVSRLRDLPEWAVKMDRQRLTDLIKNIMSDTVEVDQLELNFCEQVMGSAVETRVITFDTEAALQCPAELDGVTESESGEVPSRSRGTMNRRDNRED